MKTRRFFLGGMAAAAMGTGPTILRAQAGRESIPWVVYYDDAVGIDAFDPYSLVVLDRQYHPPLLPLQDAGKTVFGYISMGEVNENRPEYQMVNDWGILRGENPFWPGSQFVDVRDRRWAKLILEQIVPEILQRGFDGLFLDTLDNPVELERRDPSGNAGMTAAAARLVRALKVHWPDVPVILNRGYGLLPEVTDHIDYILGESVYADYDFETKSYKLVETDLYRQQVSILKDAMARNRELTVLTLDYWDPADTAMLRQIYEVQRENGFSPYVATIDLDVIVPEPPA